MGGAKRFWSKLAFLLILPERVIEGELAFGLMVVWIHPYQAHIPSLEGAVKTCPNYTFMRKLVYAFVKFNNDDQYAPSLKKVS